MTPLIFFYFLFSLRPLPLGFVSTLLILVPMAPFSLPPFICFCSFPYFSNIPLLFYSHSACLSSPCTTSSALIFVFLFTSFPPSTPSLYTFPKLNLCPHASFSPPSPCVFTLSFIFTFCHFFSYYFSSFPNISFASYRYFLSPFLASTLLLSLSPPSFPPFFPSSP